MDRQGNLVCQQDINDGYYVWSIEALRAKLGRVRYLNCDRNVYADRSNLYRCKIYISQIPEICMAEKSCSERYIEES